MIIDSELQHHKITVAQALALHRVYMRGPLAVYDDRGPITPKEGEVYEPLSFEDFVKSIGVGSDCIMVQWCGMWLGIETDGHTHS